MPSWEQHASWAMNTIALHIIKNYQGNLTRRFLGAGSHPGS